MPALSASVPAFASDSLTGPPRLCTTRLATVVIDVHDPGSGHDRLGHLVRIVHGGNSGADVEELPDASLAREVAD
jgi:hypothetical protein